MYVAVVHEKDLSCSLTDPIVTLSHTSLRPLSLSPMCAQRHAQVQQQCTGLDEPGREECDGCALQRR